MRHLIAAAVPLLLAAAALQQVTPAHAAQAATMAEPGAAQLQAGCTGCHDLQMVTTKRYSSAKWDEVVQEMIGRGAPVDDADRPALVGYLAKHYGEAK